MAVIVSASGTGNLRVKVRKEVRTFFKRARVLYLERDPAAWNALSASDVKAKTAEVQRFLIAAVVLLLIKNFPEVAKLEFDET